MEGDILSNIDFNFEDPCASILSSHLTSSEDTHTADDFLKDPVPFIKAEADSISENSLEFTVQTTELPSGASSPNPATVPVAPLAAMVVPPNPMPQSYSPPTVVPMMQSHMTTVVPPYNQTMLPMSVVSAPLKLPQKPVVPIMSKPPVVGTVPVKMETVEAVAPVTAVPVVPAAAAINKKRSAADVAVKPKAVVEDEDDYIDPNLSPEQQRLVKRQRRLIKNRESAQQSRQRKKQYLDELEGKVSALTKENEILQQKYACATEELNIYRSNCTCEAVKSAMPMWNPRSTGVLLMGVFLFGLYLGPIAQQTGMGAMGTMERAVQLSPQARHTGRVLASLDPQNDFEPYESDYVEEARAALPKSPLRALPAAESPKEAQRRPRGLLPQKDQSPSNSTTEEALALSVSHLHASEEGKPFVTRVDLDVESMAKHVLDMEINPGRSYLFCSQAFKISYPPLESDHEIVYPENFVKMFVPSDTLDPFVATDDEEEEDEIQRVRPPITELACAITDEAFSSTTANVTVV